MSVDLGVGAGKYEAQAGISSSVMSQGIRSGKVAVGSHLLFVTVP